MRHVIMSLGLLACLSASALAQDSTPPAAVSDLNLGAGIHAILVTWTATGDDGYSGTATEYDLRYAVYQINGTNFESASRLTTDSPLGSGETECYVFSGFSSCTTYYFALKVKDDADNWSPLSNLPSIQTDCSGSRAPECP